MIRIVAPPCIVCNGAATLESELWPSVKLCFDCQSKLQYWLIEQGLADGNPFFFEVAYPVNNKIPPWIDEIGAERIAYWAPSEYDSKSFSQHWIRLPKYSKENA